MTSFDPYSANHFDQFGVIEPHFVKFGYVIFIKQRKTLPRKHYLSNNSCKKPSETEEEKNQKEPEVKYRCPGHPTCSFFGPLRLILIHMYKHPEANVKFRQGIKAVQTCPVRLYRSWAETLPVPIEDPRSKRFPK